MIFVPDLAGHRDLCNVFDEMHEARLQMIQMDLARLRWIVLPILALCLAGCVNQIGADNPYRVFDVSDDQVQLARGDGRPFVVNSRGYMQTIEIVEFDTKQFGRVRIQPNFVSDGSSRPFDKDPGSNMAALLHDALYRGAPQLKFLDGYPGPWTKAQADSAYCLQLQRLETKEKVAAVNCRAVRFLQVSSLSWQHHQKRREAYWKRMEPPENDDALRTSFGSKW